MTEIYEYETVRCSFEDLPERLGAYFAAHADEGGKVVLHLRAPLGDLTLEHAVIVTLFPLPSYVGYHRMHIHWTPTGQALYPAFDGILRSSGEGSGFSRLDLEGSYDPPFGPAGAILDAAIGKRVAQCAVRALLEDVKRSVESGRAPGATILEAFAT